MSREFDIVISGGGVAGAATAALLARDGCKVALVDRRRPRATAQEAEFDPRVVAISPGAHNVLNAAGGWRNLPAQRVAPFARMAVHAGDGSIEFSAGEHGLAQLGWIVEVPTLQHAMWQALESERQVELIAPASVERIEQRRGKVSVNLNDDRRLQARLVVAADGALSRLRRQTGIASEQWHYNQHAMVCHVATESPNPGLAWQRFTEHGPLALLPLPDGRSSIVWSLPSRLAAEWRGLDENAFLERLNAHQDSPFGPASACTHRYIVPLVRRRSTHLVSGSVVLLGDAARTVHPLAGQGLNLGLMDAAALAEVLDGADDPSAQERALARYERWRLSAGTLVAGGIHAINEFTAGNPVGRTLAGFGFGLAGGLWPVREWFVQKACGIDSDSPRTARQET